MERHTANAAVLAAVVAQVGLLEYFARQGAGSSAEAAQAIIRRLNKICESAERGGIGIWLGSRQIARKRHPRIGEAGSIRGPQTRYRGRAQSRSDPHGQRRRSSQSHH